MPGRWRKANEKDLATFVSPDAAQYLPRIDGAFAMLQNREARLELVRRIYDSIANKSINYSWEEFHPSDAIQLIRTPLDLIVPPRKGTCLDLVTFFSGVCIGYDLLPIILMFDGHAFAAVSLTHNLPDWSDPTRPGFHKLRRGLAGQADLANFRDMVERGEYVAVECTGSASRKALPADRPERGSRDSDVLSFDEAVRVGLDQLHSRTLHFGIDIAAVHYGDRIEPSASPSGIAQPELYVADSNKRLTSLTAQFVERDDVNVTHLRDFASRFKCGYFHIKGDSGVGKTALAASLARTLEASIVFADVSGGITTPVQCWRYLAAGMIVSQGLPEMGLWDLADYQWQKPVVDRLMRNAAALMPSHSPTWLVIDALDETRNPSGSNPLYLPDTLPHGIYVLLTSRSLYPWKPSPTDPEMGYEERTLEQDSKEQTRAIVSYLTNLLSSEKGEDLLRAARAAAPDKFVERLSSASLGNFKYLEFVISHLLSASGAALFDSGGLPRGLDEYYDRFFRAPDDGDRNPANLEQFRADIGALLAAAREPVTARWLADHSGASVADVQKNVLSTWFGPLSFQDRGAYRYYRVVHQSFADFLGQKRGVDFAALHAKIGAYYLDEKNRPKHESYAVRQLTAHLRKGANIDALVSLLSNKSWHVYSTSEAGDPTGSALVADVEEAWTAANEIDRRCLAADSRQLAPLLGFEVYCALLKSTFLTRSQTVPVSLLVTQVTRGRWSIARAATLAELNPDADARNHALSLLSTVLKPEPDAGGTDEHENALANNSPEGGEDSVEDAGSAGELIPAAEMAERLPAYLAELSPWLARTGHPRTALELARVVGRPFERADALARLVDVGMDPAPELLDEAWAAIRILDDGEARHSAIEALRKTTASAAPPPHSARPGHLTRVVRRVHAVGSRLDHLAVTLVVSYFRRTLEFEVRRVPLLTPPPELRALELAVGAPHLLIRGLVSMYKLALRLQSVALVVMCVGLFLVMAWSDSKTLVQAVPYALAGLGLAVIATGVAAIAVRKATIRAWLQRRRVHAESGRRIDKASLEPPSTDDEYRDAAEASLFVAACSVVRFVFVGLVIADILVPIVIYGALLVIVPIRFKDAPLGQLVLAVLLVPLFLSFGYIVLWHTGIRWLAIVFALLASLGFAWPVVEIPALMMMLVGFGMWGWHEIRSTSRKATRNLSKLRMFLRRAGYSLGVLVHPWGRALGLVSPSSSPDERQVRFNEQVAPVAERLLVYNLWQQQLRTNARAKRKDLLGSVSVGANRQQMVMLGGPRVLGDVSAAIELVGFLWP